ncbi:alpha/beta hydrolase [Rhodospirillum rubrum]|uniref:alpha/beta fold hydrolase n=1 Tax=Rhodospirillum rubrum TaxID=1085 RepID=UPI0019049E54|nr:alpha/beta hydrolase [Rhodospirillum rubrum]MBK1664155.1 alpha/beta hydrolase [Rhodospirillum rubrum]MBK1675824.1 alpha/beta hydrolase [Rhodospirillum rubrum]
MTKPLLQLQDSVAVLRPEGFRHMAYVEWRGDHDAPPAFCVHGLTRNGRDFDGLAQALAASRRVFCPDVLGRGRSDCLADPAGYANLAYAADMVTLIARSGGGVIDWVGTSMGGLIGMILAAMPGSPIRRLVLNDVGPFVPQAAMARIRDYVGYDPVFDTLAELEAYLRKVHAPFGPLSDGQWRTMAEHGHWRIEDGRYKLARDPAIAVPIKAAPLADVSLWPLWDAITCPVLVIHGEESDLLGAETVAEMAGRGPGCEVVEVAGVGHAPALLTADQIAPIVDFLA